MDRARCTHCGEIIGVYEPVRLLMSDGVDLSGSVLTLGEQLWMSGNVVLHERCFEGFERRVEESVG